VKENKVVKRVVDGDIEEEFGSITGIKINTNDSKNKK
jgi:hypothetical protein